MGMEDMRKKPSTYDRSRMDATARMRHPGAAPDRLPEKKNSKLAVALALAGAFSAGTASQMRDDQEIFDGRNAIVDRTISRAVGQIDTVKIKRTLSDLVDEARATLDGRPHHTEHAPVNEKNQTIETQLRNMFQNMRENTHRFPFEIASHDPTEASRQEQAAPRTWEQMGVWEVERLIQNNELAPEDQLRFFERELKPGGEYHRIFYPPEHTPENLNAQNIARVLRMANVISARLNSWHEQKLRMPGYDHLYAKETLQKVKNSNRVIQENCNIGFYYDDAGALRVGSAAHCLPVLRTSRTFGSFRFSYNIAQDTITYALPTDPHSLRIFGFKDADAAAPTRLPHLDPRLTSRDVIGKPVISYSWKPNIADSIKQTPKAYYSVALPVTDAFLRFAGGADLPYDLNGQKGVVHNEGMLFTLVPTREGDTAINPATKKPEANASGSSGALVSLPTPDDGVKAIGHVSQVWSRNIGNEPIAIEVFNTPEMNHALVEYDRKHAPVTVEREEE